MVRFSMVSCVIFIMVGETLPALCRRAIGCRMPLWILMPEPSRTVVAGVVVLLVLVLLLLGSVSCFLLRPIVEHRLLLLFVSVLHIQY